jgi:hypothetical protein
MRKRAKNEDGMARKTVSAKVPIPIIRAVEEIAKEEDRSFSNQVAQLLKESPRVASKLAAA